MVVTHSGNWKWSSLLRFTVGDYIEKKLIGIFGVDTNEQTNKLTAMVVRCTNTRRLGT